MASLFSDYLTALGVRHTEKYSDSRFAGMPFHSLFGLGNLLKEYGVESVAIQVDPEARETAITALPLPFLADTPRGFIIVTHSGGGNIIYTTQHRQFTAPVADILDGWNGVALLASAGHSSIEPGYSRHHIDEVADKVKRIALWITGALLLVLAMWYSGLSGRWAAWMLLAFNCAGLVLSWMLVQKSLGIHSGAADAVCSVLEEGGCDTIAKSEAASFFGIVKWSEVGLAYFSVSLMAMLLFPTALPALAAINILCLPYTIWSITYQKFVAKTWCTLCVCVQATLWALFAGYLLGGWTQQIFPLSEITLIHLSVLGCVYAFILLALNRFDGALEKIFDNGNSNS